MVKLVESKFSFILSLLKLLGITQCFRYTNYQFKTIYAIVLLYFFANFIKISSENISTTKSFIFLFYSPLANGE